MAVNHLAWDRGNRTSDETSNSNSEADSFERVQFTFKTSIPEQPVTLERLPYIPRSGEFSVDAGVARATSAVSKESPNGTTEGDYTRLHQHQTQHVDYWDQDHDNIIWPSDTYNGCRAWGWSIPLCLLVTFIINVGLSYPTCPTLFPDPFFRIYMARLYKDKHGSDSMTYDNEGRFRPQQFEDIFAKYDRGKKGGLTWGDLFGFWRGQAMVFDLFGMSASIFEWTATYLLLWPADGIMRKEDIRRIFDGSIFYKKAEDYQQRKQVRSRSRTNSEFVKQVKKLL